MSGKSIIQFKSSSISYEQNFLHVLTQLQTRDNHTHLISVSLISNPFCRATKPAAKLGRRRRYAEHAPQGLPWQNCGAHSAPGPVGVRKRETTKPSGVRCQVPHGTQSRIVQWKVNSLNCLAKFSHSTFLLVSSNRLYSLIVHVNVIKMLLKLDVKVTRKALSEIKDQNMTWSPTTSYFFLLFSLTSWSAIFRFSLLIIDRLARSGWSKFNLEHKRLVAYF